MIGGYMQRVFISFTLLILMAIGSMGGCDGGGGNIILPTPPPGTQGCLNCPCDFFSVPTTVECWGSDRHTFLDGNAFQETAPGTCMINDPNLMAVSSHDTCGIGQFQSDICDAPNEFDSRLRPHEVTVCRLCLGEYATALNDAGIRVMGGPPYICATPPTPVPTPPSPSSGECDFVPDESGQFYTEDDCAELADAFGCSDFSFQGDICEVFGCEDCLCDATSQIAEGVIGFGGCATAAAINNCFNPFFDEVADECHLFVCFQAPCGPIDVIIP